MSRRAPSLAVLVLIATAAAACSGDRPTLLEEGQSPTTTTAVTPSTSLAPAAERQARRLDDAVERLIDADSYRFESRVAITAGEEETLLLIDGWVDGDDRELTMRNGEQASTTRVVDGVATVERDGQVTVVPLEAAPAEPSLTILTRIDQVSYAPGDLIRGTLDEAELVDAGFDVDGSARVTITLIDGQIHRYKITGDSGAWSIQSTFSDIDALSPLRGEFPQDP